MPGTDYWWITPALTIVVSAISSFWGAKIAVAKLEVHADNHADRLRDHDRRLDEQSDTINSHSLQLAFMDGSGRHTHPPVR